MNLLKLVGDDSAGGLDVTKHDWADVLSGGEKQRIGLARVFFRKPTCAVLDEATSAVNPDEEALFYRKLATLGVTAFSIAHRPEPCGSTTRSSRCTRTEPGGGRWRTYRRTTYRAATGTRDAGKR